MKARADRWRNASDLISDLGIRAPEEIDVEAVAELLGATVVYEELHGCQASIVGRKDRAIITVDRSAPRERQRFSAAHELAHWIFDHSEAGFACTDELLEVEWWDDDGEEVLMSLEQRANEWACQLLLPEQLLAPDADRRPVTFEAARQLAGRYATELAPAVQRLVSCSHKSSMLVVSRPGQPLQCLKHSGRVYEIWLQPEPGPGTVAHELLRGSREQPGSTEVAADGWIDHKAAWWLTLFEDSRVMPSGEVWSLLWWTDDGFELLMAMVDKSLWLAPEPGEAAWKQLVEGLGREWGYWYVPGTPGETVLMTQKPSLHRIVIPDHPRLDAAGVRRVVDEVARHREIHRDDIVDTLLEPEPYLRRLGW